MKKLLLISLVLLSFSFANEKNPVTKVLTQENTFTETQTFDSLIEHSQVTKTSSYTASAEEYIFCNATSNVIVVTLPAVAEGLQYTVKKTDASANAVTVSTNASELIDGEATQALTTQYDVITVVGTSTEWLTL